MTKMKTSKKQLFFFNGLLFVIAIIFIQYSIATHSDEVQDVQISSVKPVLQGRFAEAMTVFDEPQDIPNIEFKTIFGKDMSLDDLKGEWVIVNFWATWCAPCLVEMPSLQALQDAYGGQGVRVVAISLDRNMTGDKLREFMNDKGFGPVAAYYDATNSVMRSLSLRGLPTSIILSPNGKAIGKFEGDADWVGEDAKAFIASLLAPAQP